MYSAILSVLLGAALGACVTWIIGYLQQGMLWRRLRAVIMDRHHICINEEFLLTRMVSERIKKAGFNPDVIFAIIPGGGMIADWLARAFLGDFRHTIPVRSICVQSKRTSAGTPNAEPVVLDTTNQVFAGMPPDLKVLLVNDISRGGQTLSIVLKLLQKHFQAENIKIATLFCHVDAWTKPDFCAILTAKTVNFDWKQPQPGCA